MRSGVLLLVIAAACGSGCTLARNAVHNLTNETVSHWDEKKLSRRLRAQADAAWLGYCAQAGGQLSEDFAGGFRDGYADYLESGGNGSPPAVPPLRYRRSQYLSPEGHGRVRDYFAGFKAGTDCAAASGHRHYLTVPVLLSDDPPPTPLPGVQLPAATVVPSTSVLPSVVPSPVRVGERLPAPRPMDAATGLPIPERPTVQPLPKTEPPVPVVAPVPKPEPPAPDPLTPAIPVAPPPQSSKAPPAEPPPVVRVSAELPAEVPIMPLTVPGVPLTLPPVPPPEVPSLRRSTDR